jgi:adenine-specific DNA-methyltransferase
MIWLDREGSRRTFDILVGNPPYIRYQLLNERDRTITERILADNSMTAHGVSNAWTLFALLSLLQLRIGGAFALVLPFELITTISAGAVRKLLLEQFTDLRVELVARGAFPGILQDVVLISGRRARASAGNRRVRFADTRGTWEWSIPTGEDPWTRYLLSHAELSAYEAALAHPSVRSFDQLARLQVAIVTGANDFFTVDDRTLDEYRLHAWARPLLAKTTHAPGLRFTSDDFHATRLRGNRAWLLDFAAGPEPSRAARRYLARGEAQGLPDRYKCRIREPWYAVPHVERGALMLPKRCHRHHRLLLNSAEVFTTDTVYRGATKPGIEAGDLVSLFHNSLTLLSAELEGRAYGGGVLELIPSEVAKLRVPWVAGFERNLEPLDALSRGSGGQLDPDDRLVARTDALLAEAIPSLQLEALTDARIKLRARRFGQALIARSGCSD